MMTCPEQPLGRRQQYFLKDDEMSNPSLPVSAKKKVSRLAMALEPRMMFDAAMVQTAEAIAAASPVPHPASGAQGDVGGSAVIQAEAMDSLAGDVAREETQARQDAGTEGTDSSHFTLRAASMAESSDDAPSLGAVTGNISLDEFHVSNDWPSPYSGIQDVVDAGKWVYVVRSGNEFRYDAVNDTYGFVDFALLNTYERAENGSLVLKSSMEANEQNGLAGVLGVGRLADGNTLYTLGERGVATFSIDPATGALVSHGVLADDLQTANHVLSTDSALYVTTGEKLHVFTRESGAWVARAAVGATDEFSQLTAMQRSADGQFLYVGTMGSQTQVTVFRIGSDGSLTHELDVKGGAEAHYVNHLVLSRDGKSLYVSDNTSLYTLSVAADGSLAPIGEPLALASMPKQVMMSGDGAALIVVGSKNIELYTRSANGSLSQSASFSAFDRPSGSSQLSLGEIRSADLSLDGSHLYLAGQFSFVEGVVVLALKPVSSTFVERGDPVALIPGGTLSDPQLDARANGAGNYQGASIVVERNDGMVAGDRFSLLEGAGLSLSNDGEHILLNGAQIASFAVDAQTGRLTVTFSASLSQAEAQQVLRHLAYASDSKDPTATSDKAAFTLIFNDGDGFSALWTAEVGLVGVNDAPTVSVEAVDSTFYAEGEAVPLFRDAVVDTIETGQKIWQVIVTLDAKVGSGDILRVAGGQIVLSADSKGVLTTASGVQYQVRDEGDSTRVIILLNTTPERAQQIIEGLTYSNSGSDLSGSRTIGLAVKENGSGGNTDGVAEGKATVTLKPAQGPNTPPALTGHDGTIDYVEQAEPVRLLPDARVSDAQMDAFAGGQGNYAGAVLTIALAENHSGNRFGLLSENGLELVDGTVRKDGTTIAIVRIDNGVLTLRFTDEMGAVPTSADVQHAMRQITYANSSDLPPESIGVTVKLADQRGMESETLAFTIVIESVNDLPEVKEDPVLSLRDLETLNTVALAGAGLSAPTASAVSADGRYFYVAAADGKVALFSRNPATDLLSHVQTFEAVDTVGGIQQLVVAKDGRSVYALSSDGAAIVSFGVNESGSLSHQATVRSDYAVDRNVLSGMRQLAISDDGRNLYVSNGYTLGYLSRDESGTLTFVDEVRPSGMWSPPHLWSPTELVVRDDLVYTVTNTNEGSTLIVYRRSADGSLNHIGYVRSAGEEGLAGLQHLSVSADGTRIAVASAQRVDVFTLETDTGILTHVYGVKGLENLQDVAVSAEGRALYMALADGTVQYRAFADGSLVGTYTQVAGAGNLVVADSGALLAMTADAVNVFKEAVLRPPTVVTGGNPVLLFPTYQLSDIELDGKAAGGNYGGATLLVTADAEATIGFAEGNGLALVDGRIVRDGVTLATLTLLEPGHSSIRFAEGVGKADANAILRQLNYAWHGAGVAGQTTATLHFNDGDGGVATLVKDIVIYAVPLPGDTGYALPTLIAGRDMAAIVLPETLFLYADRQGLAWSIENLPDGMHFDAATQTISGKPVQAGTVPLIVTVTDSLGATVSVTLGLTVRDNVAPELGPDVEVALPAVPVGQAVDYTLPQELFTDADGDTLNLGISGLPSGLVFDPATGKISGVATSAGRFSLVITATDPNGASVTRTAIWQIAALAPSVEARPSDSAYTIGGTPVPVFSDVEVAVNGAGETVQEMVLALDGMATQGQDILVVDGASIVMRAGESGVTPGGHAYRVVQEGSGLRLTLTAGAPGMDATVAAALLEGMRYTHLGHALDTAAVRTITLVSLRDNGDTAGGGTDRVTLALRTVITLAAPEPEVPEVPILPEVPPPSDEAPAGVSLSYLQPDTAWGRSSPVQGRGGGHADLLQRPSGSAGWQPTFSEPGRERPLGYAPLAGTDMANLSGTRGLPFYLVDTQPWQVRATEVSAQPDAQHEAQDSDLVASGAKRLYATLPAVQGAATWDAAQACYRYQLADGLFEGGRRIAAIVLAQADGSPVPDGVTLDRQHGQILLRGISGRLDLVLIAQANDGQEAVVRVTLDVPASEGRTAAGPGLTEGMASGKPAFSSQMDARTSLTQQIDVLLARLG